MTYWLGGVGEQQKLQPWNFVVFSNILLETYQIWYH